MTTLRSKKQIAKSIESIATGGLKRSVQIQNTLLNIAGHAHKHGDCTQFIDLHDALRTDADKKLVVTWAGKFGMTTIKNGEINLKKAVRKQRVKEFPDTLDFIAHLEQTADQWDAPKSKPKKTTAFDLAKAVKRNLDSVPRHRDNGREVVIDKAEVLAVAQMLIDAVS